MTTIEKNFRNSRFSVNESTILSQSTWDYGTCKKFSVALFRKVNGAWVLDYETVNEGGTHATSKSEKALEAAANRRDYQLIDFSRPLLEAEMKEVPVRFYRDNVIEKKGRRITSR